MSQLAARSIAMVIKAEKSDQKENKLSELKRLIRERRNLIVAFSGGVDSTLLAKVAADVLGDRAYAVILKSETFSKNELEMAKSQAKILGINFVVEDCSILNDDRIAENSNDRCYWCKKKSAKVLWSAADRFGTNNIADGLNLSDYCDFRPGIRGSDEEGIWHPFVDSKMTKDDIRSISKSLGISNWNQPSNACLASRIPYHEKITIQSLRMVEDAESLLKNMGFGQLRVRAHGRLARIELEMDDMEKAFYRRIEIAEKLKEVGFEYVTVDLNGFRSGRMNEVLWTSRE